MLHAYKPVQSTSPQENMHAARMYISTALSTHDCSCSILHPAVHSVLCCKTVNFTPITTLLNKQMFPLFTNQIATVPHWFARTICMQTNRMDSHLKVQRTDYLSQFVVLDGCFVRSQWFVLMASQCTELRRHGSYECGRISFTLTKRK